MQKNNQIISIEAKLEIFKDEPNKTYTFKKSKKKGLFYGSQIGKFQRQTK